MAELSRQHAKLSPVMSFVSDEVIQKVYDVGGEILPGCRWNGAAASHRQLDQINHSTTTAWERAQEFSRLYVKLHEGTDTEQN